MNAAYSRARRSGNPKRKARAPKWRRAFEDLSIPFGSERDAETEQELVLGGRVPHRLRDRVLNARRVPAEVIEDVVERRSIPLRVPVVRPELERGDLARPRDGVRRDRLLERHV